MNLSALCRCSRTTNNLRSLSRPLVALAFPSRRYATRRDNLDFSEPGSLLSHSLDTNRSEAKHDTVGPFQLGLSQSALRKGEKVPKWSELSAGGKVLRTTARTTNFGVILLGAGLSVLLVYSLTSELFSKNSATVLYGDACERIKASPRIAKYLNTPLVFHNNPPSAIRPRHRNRQVTSQIMVDPNGQEHMIMTFYVQGQAEAAEHHHSEVSYFTSATYWARDKFAGLSNLTFEQGVDWSKEHAGLVWDSWKNLFKYLTGSPLPRPPLPTLPRPEEKETTAQHGSGMWNFAGMFSSLKGTTKASRDATKTHGVTYTDGEVHADLVRNNDGYFVFRYLLVDIPSSRDPNNVRVFVERAPGVREHEPVMRWVS